jgi:hypothetical protein
VARDLQAALGIYRHLGDRAGQVNALSNMAIVRQTMGSPVIIELCRAKSL